MMQARLLIFICVVIMALGQVLFKQVAVNYNKTGLLFNFGVLGVLMIAGILYVTATGLWVWALRSVDLSKAYPFFAFGFVFVPLMGVWLFGETLTVKYAIGAMLIVAGVIMTGFS